MLLSRHSAVEHRKVNIHRVLETLVYVGEIFGKTCERELVLVDKCQVRQGTFAR